MVLNDGTLPNGFGPAAPEGHVQYVEAPPGNPSGSPGEHVPQQSAIQEGEVTEDKQKHVPLR